MAGLHGERREAFHCLCRDHGKSGNKGEETGIGFRAAGGISRFVAHLLLLLCYYQGR